MLEAIDQYFNLSGAGIRLREDNWPRTTERPLPSEKPLTGGVGIPLEEFQCLTKDPRHAHKAIRFLSRDQDEGGRHWKVGQPCSLTHPSTRIS